MTKKRQMIIDLLNLAGTPLSAAQIHEGLLNVPDMATVYRALKYLESRSEVASFVFDCDERGVERYYTRGRHQHFMHCSSCHHFFPLSDCPLGTVVDLIEKDTGFKVENHTLTLKGLCRECRL